MFGELEPVLCESKIFLSAPAPAPATATNRYLKNYLF
jgi:hypothetical protein